jgi:hypothetical protein
MEYFFVGGEMNGKRINVSGDPPRVTFVKRPAFSFRRDDAYPRKLDTVTYLRERVVLGPGGDVHTAYFLEGGDEHQLIYLFQECVSQTAGHKIKIKVS